jgi:hypothetical protein
VWLLLNETDYQNMAAQGGLKCFDENWAHYIAEANKRVQIKRATHLQVAQVQHDMILAGEKSEKEIVMPEGGV